MGGRLPGRNLDSEVACLLMVFYDPGHSAQMTVSDFQIVISQLRDIFCVEIRLKPRAWIWQRKGSGQSASFPDLPSLQLELIHPLAIGDRRPYQAPGLGYKYCWFLELPAPVRWTNSRAC